MQKALSEGIQSLTESYVDEYAIDDERDFFRLLGSGPRNAANYAASTIETATFGWDGPMGNAIAAYGAYYGSIWRALGGWAGGTLDITGSADAFGAEILESYAIGSEYGFALGVGQFAGTNDLVAGWIGFDPVTGELVENQLDRIATAGGKFSRAAGAAAFGLKFSGIGRSSFGVSGDNHAASPRFVDLMDVDEAARYREYWQRNAPVQVQPGVRLIDDIKFSSDSITEYRSVSYYDLYGRLEGQSHFTTHPNQRGVPHPEPHFHVRDHYCPANAGMFFANLNDFNELR